MEVKAYKYGMRLRPYGMGCQPKDGFVCMAEGGTVDGYRYHNFVYYISKLDKETAAHYNLHYLGATHLTPAAW